MEEPLRDCPFCGSTKVQVLMHHETRLFEVTCDECWASGPPTRDRMPAIEEWNHRADDEPDGHDDALYVKTWGW